MCGSRCCDIHYTIPMQHTTCNMAGCNVQHATVKKQRALRSGAEQRICAGRAVAEIDRIESNRPRVIGTGRALLSGDGVCSGLI